MDNYILQNNAVCGFSTALIEGLYTFSHDVPLCKFIMAYPCSFTLIRVCRIDWMLHIEVFGDKAIVRMKETARAADVSNIVNLSVVLL